jgi:hypothetical protein
MLFRQGHFVTCQANFITKRLVITVTTLSFNNWRRIVDFEKASKFVMLFAIVTMTDSIEAVDLRNWA